MRGRERQELKVGFVTFFTLSGVTRGLLATIGSWAVSLVPGFPNHRFRQKRGIAMNVRKETYSLVPTELHVSGEREDSGGGALDSRGLRSWSTDTRSPSKYLPRTLRIATLHAASGGVMRGVNPSRDRTRNSIAKRQPFEIISLISYGREGWGVRLSSIIATKCGAYLGITFFGFLPSYSPPRGG